MEKLSYKRRVSLLMACDCVLNQEYAAPTDWAIASLYIPAAALVDGEAQAKTLAAIHDAVGVKILNDYGEIDMSQLDPSNMTDEQFLALWDACEAIDMDEIMESWHGVDAAELDAAGLAPDDDYFGVVE